MYFGREGVPKQVLYFQANVSIPYRCMEQRGREGLKDLGVEDSVCLVVGVSKEP